LQLLDLLLGRGVVGAFLFLQRLQFRPQLGDIVFGAVVDDDVLDDMAVMMRRRSIGKGGRRNSRANQRAKRGPAQKRGTVRHLGVPLSCDRRPA
jgi:hypothetical protein